MSNLHFGSLRVHLALRNPVTSSKKETPRSVKSPRGQKRPKAIRLDDLLPKQDVTGGSGRPGILFGQVDKGKLGPKES